MEKPRPEAVQKHIISAQNQIVIDNLHNLTYTRSFLSKSPLSALTPLYPLHRIVGRIGSTDGLEILQLCLNAGVDINGVDVNGLTALHVAACSNHHQAFFFLLQHGADKIIEEVEEKYRLILYLYSFFRAI